MTDTAEETGQKISESLGSGGSFFGNLGNTLKESFGNAANSTIPLLDKVSSLSAGLSGAQLAAVGSGAAIAGVGVLAVGSAMDVDSAMNQLQASTGATADQTEKYRKVMEDVYNNNYGENFGDIGDAIAQVTKNLGDMDEAELQNVTESFISLSAIHLVRYTGIY